MALLLKLIFLSKYTLSYLEYNRLPLSNIASLIVSFPQLSFEGYLYDALKIELIQIGSAQKIRSHVDHFQCMI